MALDLVKQLTVFAPLAAYVKLPLLLHPVYRNSKDITLTISPSDLVS